MNDNTTHVDVDKFWDKEAVALLLGACRVLEILLSSELLDSMIAEASSRNRPEFFEGFKRLIDGARRVLHQAILDAGDHIYARDDLLSRADFIGIPLSEIGSNSSKFEGIVGLYRVSRKLLKQTDWNSLSAEASVLLSAAKITSDNLLKFSSFDESVSAEISSIDICAVATLSDHFHDFRHRTPVGFNNPLLTDVFDTNSDTRLSWVDGYCSGLAAVWRTLLPSQVNVATVMDELEKCDLWSPWDLERQSRESSETERSQESEFISLDTDHPLVDLADEEETIDSVENMDSVWDFMNAQSRRPELPPGYRAIDDLFDVVMDMKIDSQGLTPRELHGSKSLRSVKLPGPLPLNEWTAHSGAKFILNKRQKLLSNLLWYPVEYIDAVDERIFNGVFAFAALLRGLVSMDKREPVKVIVASHPGNHSGDDFSFGCLIKATSTISDRSGWVMFGSVAADIPMEPDPSLEYIHRLLDELTSSIELIDLGKVSVDELIDSLGNNLRSGMKQDGYDQIQQKVLNKDLTETLQHLRALALELLTENIANTRAEYVAREFPTDSGPIDLIAVMDNQIFVYECVLNAKSVEAAGRLEHKVDQLLKNTDYVSANADKILEDVVTNEEEPIPILVTVHSDSRDLALASTLLRKHRGRLITLNEMLGTSGLSSIERNRILGMF